MLVAKSEGEIHMQIYIDEYINYLKVEKNCSKLTLRNYKSDIEQFAKEMEVGSIQDISKYNIRAFLGKLVDNKQEPSTRNRKLTAIRSFCKYLVIEEHLIKNPSLDISYAKLEDRLPKVMTKQVTNSVIDSAVNLRDKAALETFYGTGCRIDELINIKVEEINFADARVRVFGKGGKERVVPISVSAIAAIVDYISQRTVVSDYLFPGLNPENHLSTKAMYNLVVKYGKANGVAISPHKFRHSIATHLLSNGMDIRKIQELLGHENINTTTIYAQVAIDQMANEFHSAHPRG